MGGMSTPEDEVIERLKRASAARNRAHAALTRAREELQAVIFEAHDLGIKQSEVVRVTGYNREHIRRLVRDEAEIRRRPSADHG